MALKNIGILIALCVTLAVAINQEAKSTPENGYNHGSNNPNYPAPLQSTSDEDVARRGHHNHKPHFPHNSEESQESQEKWEHKKPHRLGWHIPHIPHHHEYQKDNLERLERRRPLFLPLHPYYPYYPYAHPSHNNEEFETIEALKRKSYHGSHDPNFPLAQDNSQESDEQRKPFYHGPHHPHFPICFDSSEESSEEIPDWPFFHIPHFKPFHKKPDHENSESSEEHFVIPNIMNDLHDLLHHGHGKPHGKFPLNEDKFVEEGSGEEEIIPLSNAFDVPLAIDVEENEPNDNLSPIDFRSFLESRKSFPVVCDALNTPRYSCYNCYNYLVCKPEGGKIKSCKDPYAPYCNNGICSDTPGPECSDL